MQKSALVVIDIQNDITKHYRDIIDNINHAIDWAVEHNVYVVYIKHENTSAGTRTFKHGTRGADLVPELRVASDHIFTKYKGSVLSCAPFVEFIEENGIRDFYIAGADAVACVKSSCYNLCKANYSVAVLSDCITSYDTKQIPAMLRYYQSKGCRLLDLKDLRHTL